MPTSSESKKINEAIDIANDEFNIKSGKQILYKEKLKEKYYDRINNLIKEKIEDCDGIFVGFQIELNQNSIQGIPQGIVELKKDLNEVMISKVKDKMQKTKKNKTEICGAKLILLRNDILRKS